MRRHILSNIDASSQCSSSPVFRPAKSKGDKYLCARFRANSHGIVQVMVNSLSPDGYAERADVAASIKRAQTDCVLARC